MPTKIALVGIGGYGQHYLRFLLTAAADIDARLIAGIDPAPERSLFYETLQQANIPIYPSLEAFYQHDTADLVILSVPIHLHTPLSQMAMEHGSHVLCEKPLCATFDDATLMQETARRTGKILSIGYQWSFASAILNLKRDILAGRLGRPLRFKTLVLWTRSRAYFQRNSWAARIRSDDGAWVLDSPVHNATAHYLHNMLFLLGDRLETSAFPRSLYAELYRANPIENYDAAALRVLTQSNVELLFLTAHPVQEHEGPLLEYEFEEGVVEFPGPEGDFQVRRRNGEIVSYGDPNDGDWGKVWHTVEAMRGGPPVTCDAYTALPQLLCALGAQQAPIHTIPAPHIQVDAHETDQTVWVSGLADAWRASYAAYRTPFEVGGAPWIQQGKTTSI